MDRIDDQRRHVCIDKVWIVEYVYRCDSFEVSEAVDRCESGIVGDDEAAVDDLEALKCPCQKEAGNRRGQRINHERARKRTTVGVRQTPEVDSIEHNS